ncbi:adenylyltransferase/cytidyltransferase family protein [Sphaerisporangium sp. B11E5]|uniref:adenylyltransferase/cytidyltransferase family protein n=1 Tax=Sphaerisporangium sp. B11E5 TaxID=3153563 RepID=UPI00325E434F
MAKVKNPPVPLLAGLREELGRIGATVGLCHGCFDILHEGHVHHLREAAASADVLVVSVTAARHIDKGEGRPVFGDRARLSLVTALEMVDYAVLTDAPTAAPLIRRLRPDFYIKGADYDGSFDKRLHEERDALREVGGTFLTTSGHVFDSSTRAAHALGAAAGPW